MLTLRRFLQISNSQIYINILQTEQWANNKKACLVKKKRRFHYWHAVIKAIAKVEMKNLFSMKFGSTKINEICLNANDTRIKPSYRIYWNCDIIFIKICLYY